MSFVLTLFGCQNGENPTENAPAWTLKPPIAGATPVAATAMLPGTYPAGSRIKDREAFGGFGPCDNFPKNLGGKDWGAKAAVSIVAFPAESVAYVKHQGIALRVINRTDAAVPFKACDSAMYLVREALDSNGKWRPIESLPGSWCGNSYHRVILGPDQYWEFPARVYDGPLKTKLRFRLTLKDEQPAVYSNEFDGRINPAQFEARPVGKELPPTETVR